MSPCSRISGSVCVAMSALERWPCVLDEMLREVLTRDLARRLPPGSVVLPDEPSPTGTRRIVLDVLRFAGDTTGKVVFRVKSNARVERGTPRAVARRLFANSAANELPAVAAVT